MRKELDALSTTDKVNGAQAWTLMYILVETEKRDLFQKDIEENYDIRPATATALLKRMELDGLITREMLENDNRKKRIVPTPAAKASKQKVWQHMMTVEDKITDSVDPEDLQIFFKVLHQMIANLSSN